MTEFDLQHEQPKPSLLKQAWMAGSLVVGATAGLVGSLEALSADSVGDVVFGVGLIVAGSATAVGALEQLGFRPEQPIEN
ncbi:MAG: hypothetical protein QG553_673 [Patescibacteria group bacterium]|nr:hypothetical protein [Patescibacteria group bacterium]